MKKKIVIASILKPINDARMYEKIATSISQLDVHVFILGFKSKGADSNLNSPITQIPLFDFTRLSFKRFLAPWKYYKKLIKVKPEIIIITTHELLIVTCLYKILFGGKIIYDVQENYYRNIAFTNTYPPIFRNLLAVSVRTKEWFTRPFIDHYLLAEKNYEKEFSFTKDKSTIIENKARKPLKSNHSIIPQKGIKFLYTGTISEEYGIFEAIKLVKAIHQLDNSTTFTIIGYCSTIQTLNKVNEEINRYPFINLIGGNNLVAHQEILDAIESHHVGLLPYRANKSTMNCIPTKLYEYLAYNLPMIVNSNPIWEMMVVKAEAGITINYSQFDPQSVLESLKARAFYTSKIEESAYWEEEEKKLLKVIKQIRL